MYNALGNLGFPTFVQDESPISKLKGISYLLYLVILPVNPQLASIFFASAVLVSFLQRNNIVGGPEAPDNGVTLVQSILEEEVMNIFLSALLYLSGSVMRLMIHSCLVTWSIIHVATLADQ